MCDFVFLYFLKFCTTFFSLRSYFKYWNRLGKSKVELKKRKKRAELQQKEESTKVEHRTVTSNSLFYKEKKK